jgi:hypothetical protein
VLEKQARGAARVREVSDALGRSRSEIVHDALRRQLSVLRFEELSPSKSAV